MTESVPATVLGNPDIICPTTGEVCPARQHLVTLYSEAVGTTVEGQLPEALLPRHNDIKLALKLGELTAQTVARGCEGSSGNICPVRASMDASTTRRVAVRGIRNLIHRNK